MSLVWREKRKITCLVSYRIQLILCFNFSYILISDMAWCSKCVQKTPLFDFFLIFLSCHERVWCWHLLWYSSAGPSLILRPEDLRTSGLAEAFHIGRSHFRSVLAHARTARVNTLKEHAQVNSHKHRGWSWITVSLIYDSKDSLWDCTFTLAVSTVQQPQGCG